MSRYATENYRYIGCHLQLEKFICNDNSTQLCLYTTARPIAYTNTIYLHRCQPCSSRGLCSSTNIEQKRERATKRKRTEVEQKEKTACSDDV